jgi:hypothetical protein
MASIKDKLPSITILAGRAIRKLSSFSSNITPIIASFQDPEK